VVRGKEKKEPSTKHTSQNPESVIQTNETWPHLPSYLNLARKTFPCGNGVAAMWALRTACSASDARSTWTRMSVDGVVESRLRRVMRFVRTEGGPWAVMR
jgi:hypothetical protein